MENRPNFLVIGAARSGTTALYSYLKQHPDVFMSKRKETNFFAFEGLELNCKGPGSDYINNSITKEADYEELFQGSNGKCAVGEISPLYLYSDQAPSGIRKRIPDVKIIAVLRNPIEQAFSHYLYARRQTIEPLDDFYKALLQQEDRKNMGWQPLFQYSKFPKYFEQLKRYYDVFPASQIKIFTYEEFEEDLPAVLSEIFEFIGIDKDYTVDVNYRPNAGGVPKSQALQNIVMKPYLFTRIVGSILPETIKTRIRDFISDINLKKPKMSKKARELLIAELSDDIKNLQNLIGKDVSHWLEA